MKTQDMAVLLLATVLFGGTPLHAAEKNGLRVDISKRTIARSDKTSVRGLGSTSVDRNCVLKLDVTNNASKDFPESPVHYVILVQRWGLSESHNIERYEDDGVISSLRPAQTTSVKGGEFHLGGHLHGTSEMHVDKVAAWKVVITRNGEKVEFTSGSSFDSMDKSAKPAMTKP